jgi:hypothetical protein
MALTGVKWKVKIGKDLQYTHIVNHTIRKHLLQLLYSGHQSYDYLAGSDNPLSAIPLIGANPCRLFAISHVLGALPFVPSDFWVLWFWLDAPTCHPDKNLRSRLN